VDLTGYSGAPAGGTLARVTSRDGNQNVGMLHDPAALKTTTGGVTGEGHAYTLTSAAAAGAKITAAEYVWAEDAAAIGKVVALKIADNTGVKATQNVTLTDRPQRVAVTGTFDAGSTSRWVEAVATTTDVFSFRTGVLHVVPAAAAIARATDIGRVQIPHISHHRTMNALQAVQEVRHEEMGALFYFNGAGTAVFEGRDHRWISDHLTSVATFTEVGVPNYAVSADDLVKQVIVDFPQWVEGTAGTQVFALDRVPLTIPPNASVTIEADYGGALVRDTIVPVANTDYEINASPEGGGADESANVTVTFTDYGGGSSTVIQNNVARRVYLLFYKIRGTPVRIAADLSPIRYTPAGGPSLAADLPVSYRHNASEPAARAWATYLGDRYATQRERLSLAITEPFPVAETTGHMGDVLGLQVSERVTVVNDDMAFSTKVNGDYYIDSIDRNWGKGQIACVYRLSPVDVSMFRFDVSLLDGTDVLAP
jgi:hypothetical protein